MEKEARRGEEGTEGVEREGAKVELDENASKTFGSVSVAWDAIFRSETCSSGSRCFPFRRKEASDLNFRSCASRDKAKKAEL